jgi:hypothetical protein
LLARLSRNQEKGLDVLLKLEWVESMVIFGALSSLDVVVMSENFPCSHKIFTFFVVDGEDVRKKDFKWVLYVERKLDHHGFCITPI